MSARRFALFCLAALAAAAPAEADDDDAVHGRIALEDAASFNRADSLDALLGTRDHNDGLFNARFTFDPEWGRFSLDLHYLVTVEDGEAVGLAKAQTALVRAPPPTWLGLTDSFADSRTLLAQQGIDRLSLAYSTPDFVVRIGRQALTWGSGLVFRPMDLFDPFSPVATDTEFKPGTDMVYMQYLFADGSDLQFIAVPRARGANGAPTADESSFALHYHGQAGDLATTLMLARDHGDWTAALGLDGPLSGATWNLELLPTAERRGSVAVSALANLSDALTLLDRNATVFGEYFRNGFGVTGAASLGRLPQPLIDRLARGQLFNLRRDYLAAGLTLEWTPLVTLTPTVIADLDDGSLYLLAAAQWSLNDDLVLVAGAQQPLGGRGSEFGGLPLAPASPILLSPPAQLYLQLRQYF